MHRPAIGLLVAFLICSCNAPDATIGSAATPVGSSTRSTALTRVDLGTLGGASSYATAINSANIVVGWSEMPDGATHAFRWSNGGGMVDLGTLPGDRNSRAVAVLEGAPQGIPQILGMSGSDGIWTTVVWAASGSISAPPIP